MGWHQLQRRTTLKHIQVSIAAKLDDAKYAQDSSSKTRTRMY